MKKWKRIKTRNVFENSHWSYYIDDFTIGNNYESEYHYVHTNGSSLVIPLLNTNKLLMIEQYRYLNKRTSIEFPCGGIDKGLSAKENAIKELREETGYECRSLIPIGEFAPFTGASDEMCTIFLGRDLFINPLPKDPTETDIQVKEFTIGEIEEMISSNKIWDGLTLASWSLAKKYLQRQK